MHAPCVPVWLTGCLRAPRQYVEGNLAADTSAHSTLVRLLHLHLQRKAMHAWCKPSWRQQCCRRGCRVPRSAASTTAMQRGRARSFWRAPTGEECCSQQQRSQQGSRVVLAACACGLEPTPLTRLPLLCAFLTRRHAQVVEVLVCNGASPLVLDNARHNSALHWAASCCRADCINRLLGSGAIFQMQSGQQVAIAGRVCACCLCSTHPAAQRCKCRSKCMPCCVML